MNDFIPYGRQQLDDGDIDCVLNVLRGDWLTQGPSITSFESAFAEYVGARFAVACSNGTAALHLACLALDLKETDTLVTSPITFLASANCAQFMGATTAFVDIDPSTWCISVEKLEQELKSRKIDVVVPVHFAGHSSEMAQFKQLQQQYGFKIIEDSCHALGGEYGESRVGSCDYSDIATFSFHPVKHITCGEGGMVTTNSDAIYEKLLRFRVHGMHKNSKEFLNRGMAFDEKGEPNSWYYEMAQVGYNYRITDLQCALGQSQLTKIDKFVERRRRIAEIYDRELASLPNCLIPTEADGVRHAYHLYTLRINFEGVGKSRNRVMSELRSLGIGSQVLYIPVHLQPYYRTKYGYRPGDFPIAEEYYDQCLSIPMFSGLTDSDVDRVIQAVTHVLSSDAGSGSKK